MKWILPYNQGSVTLDIACSTQNKRIHIKAPWNQYTKLVNNEIKAMEGWKYTPDPPTWTVRDTPRNRQQLRFLQGELNPYVIREAYDAPVFDTTDLWPGQIEAVTKMLRHPRCLIAHAVSEGKSFAAIRALESLPLDERYPIWFLSPKNVKLVWLQELDKWARHLDMSQVYLVHNEQIISNHPLPPLPRNIVVDEAVNFKNAKSKRSIALAKIVKNCVRVWLLNGTVTPKDPSDIHNQTELCFPGYLRESSQEKLRFRLAITELVDTPTGPHKKIIGWKKKEVESLHKRLLPMVSFRRASHVHRYITLEVEPTPQVLQTVRMLYNMTDSGLERMNKIRQISDGFMYTPEGVEHLEISPKQVRMHTLLSELRDNEHNRTIIFAAYKAAVRIAVETAQAAGWATIQVDGTGWHSTLAKSPGNLYKIFQSPETHSQPIAMVGDPAAFGEGLTLPSPTIHFYSNSWNPKHRQQAIGRTRQVSTIYDYRHLPCDTLVAQRQILGKTLQSITMGEFDASLADIIKEKKLTHGT